MKKNNRDFITKKGIPYHFNSLEKLISSMSDKHVAIIELHYAKKTNL